MMEDKKIMKRQINQFKILAPICLIFALFMFVVGIFFLFKGYWDFTIIDFLFSGLMVYQYFNCKERIDITKEYL